MSDEFTYKLTNHFHQAKTRAIMIQDIKEKAEELAELLMKTDAKGVTISIYIGRPNPLISNDKQKSININFEY